MALDFEKAKQAVHYIIWRAGNVTDFGAIKLNKVLWFSEARVYLFKGHPITRAHYVRGQMGPVSSEMLPALKALEADGIIEVWTENDETRFRTKVAPKTSALRDYEIKQFDFWIKEIAHERIAKSIGDKSHDYTWKIASMVEEIPLYAILATRLREPRGEELYWARKEAIRLGLP